MRIPLRDSLESLTFTKQVIFHKGQVPEVCSQIQKENNQCGTNSGLPNSLSRMRRFMPQAFCKRFLQIVIISTNICLALYGLQSASNLRCHFGSFQRESSQNHLGGIERGLSTTCQKMAISSSHVPNLCSSE